LLTGLAGLATPTSATAAPAAAPALARAGLTGLSTRAVARLALEGGLLVVLGSLRGRGARCVAALVRGLFVVHHLVLARRGFDSPRASFAMYWTDFPDFTGASKLSGQPAAAISPARRTLCPTSSGELTGFPQRRANAQTRGGRTTF
jgi:hypothetical protein